MHEAIRRQISMKGATESGLFLSAGIVTGLLAMVAGKKLVDETNWNQRYVRRLMIVLPTLTMLVSLASAVFINETANSPNVNFVWYLGLLGSCGSRIVGLPTNEQ
eukprot:Skav209606  [mRNA]  locus=scaffold1634:154383:160287:- [translate_table: standard]